MGFVLFGFWFGTEYSGTEFSGREFSGWEWDFHFSEASLSTVSTILESLLRESPPPQKRLRCCGSGIYSWFRDDIDEQDAGS